jgi:hypothetical protein
MKKSGVVVLVAFLLFLSSVVTASTGVSPAKYEEKFVPGVSKEYQFVFFFEESRNPAFNLSGDLKEYGEIIDVQKSGTSHVVRVRLNLPNEIEKPGENRLTIVGSEPEKKVQGTIQTAMEVSASVRIFVPYPGKYAAITLDAKNANAGEDVEYTLVVDSLGSESIVITPRLEVEKDDKILEIFSLETKTINSEDSYTYKGVIDGESIRPGIYFLTAFVDPGSGILNQTDGFRIGELRVEIIDYTKEIERNKVNKVSLTLESFWNDEITDLFVNYKTIEGNDYQKSPSIKLGPWEKNSLNIFVDTTNIEGDTIDVDVEVHYNSEIRNEILTLQIIDTIDWFTIILIVGGILGIVAIIFLIILVVYLLRKVNGKQEKK